MYGQLDIVQYLCDMDSELSHSLTQDGSSPLHYASKSGNLAIVKFLVETMRADPDEENLDGETPKSLAVKEKREDVISYLSGVGMIGGGINAMRVSPTHLEPACLF